MIAKARPAAPAPLKDCTLSATVAEASTGPLPMIDLTRLLDGRNTIGLRFGETVYHLRLTRAGKLLLNK